MLYEKLKTNLKAKKFKGSASRIGWEYCVDSRRISYYYDIGFYVLFWETTMKISIHTLTGFRYRLFELIYKGVVNA